MPQISNKRAGFSLVELLVALMVSSILIGVTTSVYSLFRKSMNADQARANIAQNGRISLDRLTRELRQTPEVVTSLPNDPDDTSVTQPHEIEFEDGHANDLSYRRYYVQSGMLKVDIKQYYFSYDTGHRVKWDSIGNSNATPLSSVVSTWDIADNVQDLSVYGSNEVRVDLTTFDAAGQTYQLRTTVYGRNL